MKNDKEIVGTLLGFDDFVNMLLDDVTEYENTPDGQRITKLDQILLNGNTITMVELQLSHDLRESNCNISSLLTARTRRRHSRSINMIESFN